MSADSKKNNLPFDPDTSKKVNRNSDGTTQSPMSRARALAKMARDRANKKEDVSEISQDLKNRYKDKAKSDHDHQKFSADIAKDMNAPDAEKHYRRKQMNRAKGIERASEAVEEHFNWKVSHGGKNVHVKAPNAGTAVKKAQRGFGNMDLTKAKITNLGKVGTPTTEATVDTANIRSRQAMKKSDTEKLGKLADMLAKEKKPKTEAKLDELSPSTHKSYQAKAFSNAALGMAKKRLGKMSAKDAYDNEVKRHKGIDTSKYLNRKQHGIKDGVEEERQDTAHHVAKTLRKMGVRHDAKEHEILPKIPHALKKHGLHNDKLIKRDPDFHGDVIDSLRGMKESVQEAKDMYKSAAGELKDYANKNGGMDKKDFHTAAKHIENIGRASLTSKGQHLAQLSKHLRNLDTSPREKVLSVLNKHGHNVGDFMPGAKMRRESVDEAFYGTQAQRLMSPLQKARQDKEKADRDKDGNLPTKVKLRGFGPDHAKGNMGNPSARAALKAKNKSDEVRENNSAPQTAAHRRAMMVGVNRSKRQADNEKARQALKDPSHNPAWANSKSKTEETVSELKKSTLGSYVNKASRDAASKAYGAASAAKDNRADQAGKDFAKSLKRLRGIDTATNKLAKEDTNEAKSFDQKFRDHLKFSMSKSPAVQAYMKKRRDDRDARHAKQDPAAVKKNYGPAVIPPGTAYNKASKRGMSPSQAANAVSNAFKNRAKRGGKLPEKFANPAQQAESTQFQVDVDGLPPTFMQGRSSAEILAKLRKIVKQPSMIKSVERKTDTDVRKVYRAKAQNREEN